MNTRPIESKILALEAAIKALAMTHPHPQEAFFKFTQIYPEMIRELNKSGSPEKSEIAKGLMAECNLLSSYFPKA
jgi:hypothetical protein